MFDIDNTICITKNLNYQKSKPKIKIIKLINDLITKIKCFLKNSKTLSKITYNERNKTLKSHNYEK